MFQRGSDEATMYTRWKLRDIPVDISPITCRPLSIDDNRPKVVPISRTLAVVVYKHTSAMQNSHVRQLLGGCITAQHNRPRLDDIVLIHRKDFHRGPTAVLKISPFVR